MTHGQVGRQPGGALSGGHQSPNSHKSRTKEKANGVVPFSGLAFSSLSFLFLLFCHASGEARVAAQLLSHPRSLVCLDPMSKFPSQCAAPVLISPPHVCGRRASKCLAAPSHVGNNACLNPCTAKHGFFKTFCFFLGEGEGMIPPFFSSSHAF